MKPYPCPYNRFADFIDPLFTVLAGGGDPPVLLGGGPCKRWWRGSCDLSAGVLGEWQRVQGFRRWERRFQGVFLYGKQRGGSRVCMCVYTQDPRLSLKKETPPFLDFFPPAFGTLAPGNQSRSASHNIQHLTENRNRKIHNFEQM